MRSCDVDRAPSLAATGGPEHCITCGDVGAPMRVLAVDDETGLARCRETGAGETEEVDVSLVAPVSTGDSVLVHAGVALVVLDPGEAAA